MVYARPIVFVIKDFDTFEANLVMSTLSPEDTELECQLSRSAAQANLQNSTTDNIILDKTNVDGDGDVEGDAAAKAADKERATHDKKDGPNNGIVNAKKRNHLLASFSDTFESNTSKSTPLDVVVRTKKRRTSNDRRRDTHIPSANGTSQTANRTEKSPPPPLLPPQLDLDSENIDVVFQDDSPDLIDDVPQLNHGNESMDVDMESNNNDLLNVPNGRDHRPMVRQIFQRCFTQSAPPTNDLGEIFVEASDEE